VDKISDTERGRELASVLIHLIDPTSNTAIRDRFFHGINLDFSECLFLFSYNDPSKVSHILLDRIKTFQIERPSREQRCEILSKHIVPRVAQRLGSRPVTLSPEAIDYIADTSERRDGGMRGAEKDVDHIMSLAQLRHAERDGVDGDVTIDRAFVEETLGQADRRQAAREAPPPGMYT
jgi:ATP-dependent Lon protease